jgi:hypothetical protein
LSSLDVPDLLRHLRRTYLYTNLHNITRFEGYRPYGSLSCSSARRSLSCQRSSHLLPFSSVSLFFEYARAEFEGYIELSFDVAIAQTPKEIGLCSIEHLEAPYSTPPAIMQLRRALPLQVCNLRMQLGGALLVRLPYLECIFENSSCTAAVPSNSSAKSSSPTGSLPSNAVSTIGWTMKTPGVIPPSVPSLEALRQAYNILQRQRNSSKIVRVISIFGSYWGSPTEVYCILQRRLYTSTRRGVIAISGRYLEALGEVYIIYGERSTNGLIAIEQMELRRHLQAHLVAQRKVYNIL